MGQRVENRQLHRGEAQLRDDAAVAELHEGMDDALRVHHDLQLVVPEAEEIVRLDHLQRLVGQRGAIHGDLLSHSPRRMPERLLHGRLLAPAPPAIRGTARPSR